MQRLPIRFDAKAKSLVFSMMDGIFYSLMFGLSETYFIAFALFLEVDKAGIGLLSTFPALIGGLSQLYTLNILRRFKSRKSFVLTGAVLQAVCLILIAAAPAFGDSKVLIFSLALTLYYFAMSVVSPVWESWMGDLVNVSERGYYFGRREWLTTLFGFISMIAGGFLLKFYKDAGNEYFGFALAFAMAFVFRMISYWFLSLKYEPVRRVHAEVQTGFWHFIKIIRQRPYGALLVSMTLVQYGFCMSSAYFTTLMVEEYNYSYVTYMWIIASMIIARALTSQFWGNLIDLMSPRRVVIYTLGMMALTFWPWIYFRDPWLLAIAGFFGGAFRTGYELASFVFLLDATKPEERTNSASYLSVITTAAGFLGGITGGAAFYFKSETLNPYVIVFSGSALVYAITYFWARQRLKDSRETLPVPTREAVLKAAGID